MIDRNTFSPLKVANRIRLLRDFLWKKNSVSGWPLEVGIEVTNFCNLHCVMCPYQEMVKTKARPQGRMEFDLFKKIIDEIAPFVELVYLHGMGEALLHPRLFEFIDYAKEKGVRVGLSTNATLLGKAKSQKLLATKIDYLIFGLDGLTKKTYEKIRRGGDFEKTVENVNDFLELKVRGNHQAFVVVQLIEMKENSVEAEGFKKYWHLPGVDVVRVKPKIALKPADKKTKPRHQPYCFHLFRQLNINWDGTVVPCCEDVFGHYILGNVQDQDLKRLWNGPKNQALRKINFENNRAKVELCRNCNYPQPGLLQAAGALVFDHLTIKKLLPRLEKWTAKNSP